MINSIRKFTGSWPAKIILGLVSLSFVLFWGISDVIRKLTHADRVVSVDGGGSVPIEAFQVAYQRNYMLFSKALSSRMDEAHAQTVILQSTISQYVGELLTDVVLDDYGLLVNEDVVRYMVARNPQFAGEDGRFSKIKFNEFLRSRQTTEQQFVSSLSSEAKAVMLRAPINIAYQMPLTLAKMLKAAEDESRSVRMYKVTLSDVKDFPKPDETVLKEFYEKKKESLFVMPEYRVIDVFHFNESEIQLPVELKEVQDLYDKRKKEEGLEEGFDEVKADLEKELQQDKNYALLSDVTKELEDRVNSKSGYEDILKKYSFVHHERIELNKNNLGKDGKKAITQPYADQAVVAAFDTSTNDEVNFGDIGAGVWLLVKPVSVERARVLNYDEISPKNLYEAWNKDKKMSTMKEMATNLVNDINSGKNVSMRYADLSPLIRMDIKALPEGINADLFGEIFKLEEGKACQSMLKDHYVVVKLLKRESPEVTNEEARDYRAYVASQLENDAYTGLINFYRSNHPVKINTEIIKMRVSDSSAGASENPSDESDDEN